MNLKSKLKPGQKNRRFAVLIEPDLSGKVSNDTELYAAIEHLKEVKIILFDESGMNPIEPPITISPLEFYANWQGD